MEGSGEVLGAVPARLNANRRAVVVPRTVAPYRQQVSDVAATSWQRDSLPQKSFGEIFFPSMNNNLLK